jgi:hypothetical protein
MSSQYSKLNALAKSLAKKAVVSQPGKKSRNEGNMQTQGSIKKSHSTLKKEDSLASSGVTSSNKVMKCFTRIGQTSTHAQSSLSTLNNPHPRVGSAASTHKKNSIKIASNASKERSDNGKCV